jgi:glycosyltransferase involved in cell wall biosynthesis
VDPAAVADLVGDAALAVVPSSGIETFGRVAAEAMARGTPAVVSDHGGLSEVVTAERSGLLFPPGDTAALISAVRSLLGNPERLAAMRTTARADFLARFTGDSVLATWEDLYRSVAAPRP